MDILLVDDSPTVRQIYAAILAEHGFAVLQAASKDEAFRLAIAHHPPIAVIDFFMPGGNGDMLIEALLQEPITSDILAVVFSMQEDVLERALAAGAIDVIRKNDPPLIFIKRILSLRRFVETQLRLREMDGILQNTIACQPAGDWDLSAMEDSAVAVFADPPGTPAEPLVVLFVDDSPTVCAIYGQLLREQGYQVTTAHGMAEAMAAAVRIKPALAVLDYFMPDGNGDALTRWLLGRSETSGTLVVVHSMRNDITEQALDAGAIDLIYKDDPPAIFLKRIAAMAHYIRSRRQITAQEHLLHRYQAMAFFRERELRLMREARDTAIRAKRFKDQFLAVMSHELRTPLNSILGMTDLLKESSLTPEQGYFVDMLSHSSALLLNHVNNLLDLSKIESGKVVLNSQPFHLATEFVPVWNMIRVLANRKGLCFIVFLEPVLPCRVMGDPMRLQQILVNLLGNAVKFTDVGMVAMIMSLQEADENIAIIRFSVQDTGPGIAAEHHQHIFEPFEQAISPGDVGYREGTGLGLTISHHLVRTMGGELSLESRSGHGSRFHFTLPMIIHDRTALGDLADRMPYRDSPGILPTVSHHGTRPSRCHAGEVCILLAEDSDDNILLMQSFLKKTGYRLNVVRTGKEAVDLFMSQPHDLVLMDIQMPEMDGYTATKIIRQWEESTGRPRTPIFALTANAYHSDAELSMQSGCDGHLTKPIRKNGLLDLLDQVLFPEPKAE